VELRMKARGAIVLVAALAGAALTARLGLWQLDRADQKLRLQDALLKQRALPALAESALARDAAAASQQLHRLVFLEGQWRAERTVYLDNRQMNDRPGFYALTPLMLDDGSAVLVQRGWMPRDPADRTHITAPPPPAGRVHVQGRIALDSPRLFEFDAVASGPIRQNLAVAKYAQEAALPLRPLVVVQEDGQSAPADGLLRQWPAPAADVYKHYGYAFQWFAMSTLITGLYVWFQLIRPSRRHV
jgi:surfeit locus 1 family protein